jgi:hypothetical protein
MRSRWTAICLVVMPLMAIASAPTASAATQYINTPGGPIALGHYVGMTQNADILFGASVIHFDVSHDGVTNIHCGCGIHASRAPFDRRMEGFEAYHESDRSLGWLDGQWKSPTHVVGGGYVRYAGTVFFSLDWSARLSEHSSG